MSAGQLESLAVGLRHVEVYRRAAGYAGQRQKQIVGKLGAVGDQRADLVAVAAFSNGAKSLDPAIDDVRQRPPAIRHGACPEVDERRAWRDKKLPVKIGQFGPVIRRKWHDLRGPLGAAAAGDRPGKSDVVVGEFKAALPVIVLLGNHPVQTNAPAGKIVHAGLPDPPTQPLPAEAFFHDVKAKKAEIIAVSDDRNGGHRRVFDKSHQEAVGIGGKEGRKVVETGIPAFSGCPVHSGFEFVLGRRSNDHVKMALSVSSSISAAAVVAAAASPSSSSDCCGDRVKASAGVVRSGRRVKGRSISFLSGPENAIHGQILCAASRWVLHFMKIIKRLLIGLLAVAVVLGLGLAGIAYYLHTPVAEERLSRMQQSSQFQEGAFVNVEPQAAFDLSWDYLKEQFFGEQKREPDGVIPVVPVDPAELAGPASQSLKSTWYGHASVLVELEGKRIFVDPVFSDRVSPVSYVGPKRMHPTPIELSKVANIDAVVISHNHYDHLDEATIRHLAADGTHFFVPLGVGAHLDAWEIDAGQIHEMAWWQEYQMDNLTIIATPSRHYSGRGLLDYKRTQWASWALVGRQQRAFYSGDSGYSKLFSDIGEKLGPFDLNIIKIGAYGPGQAWLDIHMTAENALRTHQDLKGRKMLPVHWATFNLAIHDWDEPIRRAIKAAQSTSSTLLTPKVGQPLFANRDFTNEPWWVGVKE